MDTVIGGTVSGPRPAGGSVETTYKANGEYSGNYNNPQGQGKAKQGGFFGKWTLDDNGKLCQEGTSALGQAVEACFFYFRGKDQLFVTVGSDSDRSAVALKRSVSR